MSIFLNVNLLFNKFKIMARKAFLTGEELEQIKLNAEVVVSTNGFNCELTDEVQECLDSYNMGLITRGECRNQIEFIFTNELIDSEI